VFSRFSPAAKRVLRAAEQACRNHNHYYVGVGHLLLALIEEHDPDIESRLVARGTRAADVLGEVRRALGTGDDRLWDGILVTPRVRSVIARAESSVDIERAVEPLDLFDAVLAERGGLASDVLERRFGNVSTSERVAG
jgi:ATP-dependent Clp protease ATP-binding subunit ClpA